MKLQNTNQLSIFYLVMTLAENYVAGIMLRTERTIKSGDVLEVDGIMVR